VLRQGQSLNRYHFDRNSAACNEATVRILLMINRRGCFDRELGYKTLLCSQCVATTIFNCGARLCLGKIAGNFLSDIVWKLDHFPNLLNWTQTTLLQF
jgi:hypothetical protein